MDVQVVLRPFTFAERKQELVQHHLADRVTGAVSAGYHSHRQVAVAGQGGLDDWETDERRRRWLAEQPRRGAYRCPPYQGRQDPGGQWRGRSSQESKSLRGEMGGTPCISAAGRLILDVSDVRYTNSGKQVMMLRRSAPRNCDSCSCILLCQRVCRSTEHEDRFETLWYDERWPRSNPFHAREFPRP